jgi:hypothetical protein
MVFVAVVFAVVRLCEAYETVANVLGPVGGRWLRRQALARRGAPDYDYLQQEIAALKATVGRQREDLAEQARAIIKLELTEEVNTVRHDMMVTYLREATVWSADAIVMAAEARVELPPHRTWTEFCADYRARHGTLRQLVDPPPHEVGP